MVESAGSTDRIVLQILSDLMEIRNRRPIVIWSAPTCSRFGRCCAEIKAVTGHHICTVDRAVEDSIRLVEDEARSWSEP
jgi:hypothetical protein